MPIPTTTYDNARDTVSQFIKAYMTDAGFDPQNVLQADTVDSPAGKPFVVVRWAEQEERMGWSRVIPFDIWVYDEFGDYTRATKMARDIAEYLVTNVLGTRTTTGCVSQILDRGLGGDLADDGFEALVKPYHLAAVAIGE